MNKVLLFGGSGFVGSGIKQFLSDRYQIIAPTHAEVDVTKRDNVTAIIEQIHPDIYVKGGDYEIDALAETHLVKSWGGKAVAIPFLYERSTTSLLGKIRA